MLCEFGGHCPPHQQCDEHVTVPPTQSGLQQNDHRSGTEARGGIYCSQSARPQNSKQGVLVLSNSKAFTAKTSCVRRRYSEFVWLKKQLQKNSGLVPVPELPPKTPFFSVNNEDFIEKRRQGLQQFLEKVVNRTVFLSDSQLHLFLQTQLSPAQIEACVQGHAPCSVTAAILHYASSNQGWVQEEEGVATEEDCERTLPVFYESPDSPAPRLQSSECESSSEISLAESDAHTGSDDQLDNRD
ncbi:sorting nexin-11-like [Polyodon spathula]|uniref:sorting nexin-11-like n=1 Tax=Polyodon spathula TaxID=7913 RepID=UPI001B7DA7C8|nr:sorting nexin-11-like [Polyodon spathula]